MPSYHQVLLLRSCTAPEKIASVIRSQAELILKSGGILKGVENHGIRSLAERTKLKYIPQQGERYYWDAAVVSTHFDIAPAKLDDIRRNLMLQDVVIRSHNFKIKTPTSKIHGKNYRNPYLNPTNTSLPEEPKKLEN